MEKLLGVSQLDMEVRTRRRGGGFPGPLYFLACRNLAFLFLIYILVLVF